MVADASGRIPMFFVADGTYRVRLTDSSGSTANGGFDYLQVPSIGASSSGGGGAPVDQTTVMSTGDIKWQMISGVISGWVRVNGRTVGSATSGASERANSDVQPLFLYLWNNFTDAQCPVITGRGGSAAADWAANKQITLPDLRFRSLVGLDDMGNAAAGRATGATFSSGNETTAASVGGEASHVNTISETPAHAHPLTDPGHSHTPSQGGGAQFLTNIGGVGYQSGASGFTSPRTSTDQTGIAMSNTGGGNAHNNMQPFAVGTFFMKL